jgi:large subunit ribosomal protein L7A
MERLKNRKTIGTKQTLKAIEKGITEIVFIAKDAESKVTNPLVELCNQKNVPIYYVDTMEELGKACKIDVSAAAAAVLM